MAADRSAGKVPIRMTIVTLDAHLADAFEQARVNLARDLPGLTLCLHVAADFGSDAKAAERARADIAASHIIVCTQLFQEEYANAVLPAVLARRDDADAVLCALCTPELVKCTKLGKFDMSGGESRSPFSPISLLKKLRGSRGDGKSSGERQMSALRTLPSILKFIPGTAQDVRAYLLLIQYWLAGSAENIEQMIRYAIDRYATGPRKALRGALSPSAPQTYPEVGLWHPSLPGYGITEQVSALPKAKQSSPRSADAGTVGVLVGRSYLLAGNVAHYAAVVRALEARGLRVVPAFASALDARPAIAKYFVDASGHATIDAMVNLTGFSLVGGPAYNDSNAAQEVLRKLDVPYATLQTLEFQTIDEWRNDARGLNPLQATLQIAIPELDGAIVPTVFGGKGAPQHGKAAASEPITERVEHAAERIARMVRLRRRDRAECKLAIVLFNFPPNAGNTGSAAYLAVFPSLQRVLASLKEQGYNVELPASADELRERLTQGNRERYGAPANVHTRIPVADHVRRETWLRDIEKTWGPAPGRQLSDGQAIHVTGLQLGNVFIGVQPSFGWEGDPMRLLFEGGFAPTHAFSAFYRWVHEDFAADAILHFGTHGALEFMPGKQSGLDSTCWPDRLIADTPNVYLYASNNSSEGTLAKRRGNATLVSYLTPPIANAGLCGRLLVSAEDAEVAARLVLAPRATRLPEPPPSDDAAEPEPPEPQATDNPPPPDKPDDDSSTPEPPQEGGELLRAAVTAALPPGLLAQLLERIESGTSSGRVGAEQQNLLRGRPRGARSGLPRGGARLHLLETLRAAAPWQRVRSRAAAHRARVAVRREDFRIRRFIEKTGTTVHFIVDASGSAAVYRLGEAKGAVELLLAESYARRDRVSLMAFRGTGTEVLLPPTRALARAKRVLAALPGGGGTPMATAIDAAAQQGLGTRRGGSAPLIVFLSDGRANIARDGTPGRAAAERDAMVSAKAFAMLGIPAMFIDTSPRGEPIARRLADAMRARYVFLPTADAKALGALVRTVRDIT